MMRLSRTLFFILSLLLLIVVMNSSCQNFNKSKNMKNIEFIPKEFHEVELGYYKSEDNECTPLYPYSAYLNNEIKINIPKKIIIRRPVSEIVPIIPVCGTYMITFRRGLKYDHLSAKMFYIRKVGEERWYSGKMMSPNAGEFLLPPDHDEEERERDEKVKQAQQYSDDELDEGNGWGSAFNVDLMEYVDIQLEPGVYEVYLSFSGMSSNRMRVEIIFEGDAKRQSVQPDRAGDIPDEAPEIEEEEEELPRI